jgi:hypothetical protein
VLRDLGTIRTRRPLTKATTNSSRRKDKVLERDILDSEEEFNRRPKGRYKAANRKSSTLRLARSRCKTASDYKEIVTAGIRLFNTGALRADVLDNGTT